MTQKGVEVELKHRLEAKELAEYQDYLEYLETALGYPRATAHIPNPLQKTTESLEKELNQNIYSRDNVIKKIPKKEIKRVRSTNTYSVTKVKARNFLTNVLDNRVKETDFQNRLFVIDCYSFIILYLNPFYLERKFENSIERDYVTAMWNLMMPPALYNFIYQEENFKTLNKLKLKFQDTNEIIKTFLDDNSQLEILKDYLIKYAKSYQFLYGNLFLKYFARIDDYGIESKTNFDNFYKSYLSQKNIFEWQQNSFFNVQNKNENNLTLLNLNEIDVQDVDFEKLNEIKEKEDKTTEIDGTVKEKIKRRKNDENKKTKTKRKKTKTQRTTN